LGSIVHTRLADPKSAALPVCADTAQFVDLVPTRILARKTARDRANTYADSIALCESINQKCWLVTLP
jgi:hypothetical protein